MGKYECVRLRSLRVFDVAATNNQSCLCSVEYDVRREFSIESRELPPAGEWHGVPALFQIEPAGRRLIGWRVPGSRKAVGPWPSLFRFERWMGIFGLLLAALFTALTYFTGRTDPLGIGVSLLLLVFGSFMSFSALRRRTALALLSAEGN